MAFQASSRCASSALGNCEERCGPLGLFDADVRYADYSCVCAGTVFDRFLPHRSLSMEYVDFVVPFENVGDAAGIGAGTLDLTRVMSAENLRVADRVMALLQAAALLRVPACLKRTRIIAWGPPHGTPAACSAEEVKKRLAEHQIAVELTDAAREWLLKEGYDPAYGARPLRRALPRYVENPISKGILDGAYAEGNTIVVDANAEGLTFARK